ncbi:MAG: hypothetical protein R3E48_01590 [Burkholderiaceae bacterium]
MIGVGDERWGEVGKAVIVLKADQALAADTLIGHCARSGWPSTRCRGAWNSWMHYRAMRPARCSSASFGSSSTRPPERWRRQR